MRHNKWRSAGRVVEHLARALEMLNIRNRAQSSEFNGRQKTGSDTRLMADENDPQQEPSMEDILLQSAVSCRRMSRKKPQSILRSIGLILHLTRSQRQNPYLGQRLNLYLSQAWQLLAKKWQRREWKRNCLASTRAQDCHKQSETVPQEPESALVSETQIEPVPETG